MPTLLVTLPLGLSILSWHPNCLSNWNVLRDLIVWFGGTLLLSQLGRDLGKRKERWLFKKWGGSPAVNMLRHRNAPNRTTLQRYHIRLQHLLPDLKIPTLEEENENLAAADEVYTSCVAFLREKTRDERKFPLVFEENCNYGFRRNLWGMKPLGLALAIVGMIMTINLGVENNFVKHIPIPALAIACVIINVTLLLLWLIWFTPEWVKTTADTYAERLLAACENSSL